MNPTNDDRPYGGTPGIAGGPPAQPRIAPARYAGLVAIQLAMMLAVFAIAWVLSGMW